MSDSVKPFSEKQLYDFGPQRVFGREASEADNMSKLFLPFPGILVDGNVSGTGLGISICKGIVELHGGKI